MRSARETIWAASREQLDEFEWPTHYHTKTMVCAFFSDTGEPFLNILPRNRSGNAKYLAEEIVGGLEDVCCPEERNRHERTITLHFNNAPIHNTRTVMGQLEQSGFNRMGHPADSPDLVPCDLFRFGYMKEQLKRRSFVEEEELLSVLSELMSQIAPDMILRVFDDRN
jgi:hypothetical protein